MRDSNYSRWFCLINGIILLQKIVLFEFAFMSIHKRARNKSYVAVVVVVVVNNKICLFSYTPVKTFIFS